MGKSTRAAAEESHFNSSELVKMSGNFEKDGSDPPLPSPFYYPQQLQGTTFQDHFYFFPPQSPVTPFQMADDRSGYFSQSLSLNAGDHEKEARSPSGGATSGNDMSSNESTSPTTPKFRYGNDYGIPMRLG